MAVKKSGAKTKKKSGAPKASPAGNAPPSDGMVRCAWARSPFEVPYHDREWGVPVFNDRLLFEHLLLDNAQAGLSWNLILQKREGYRKAFAEFDPEKVARFTEKRMEALMTDAGIVRNRLKIRSAVSNAQAFLKVCDERGSFADYLWEFVDGAPLVNRWDHRKQIPTRTDISDRLSKDLKKRGFKFVGTVIIYAFMQAVGMVNDHVVTCFRHAELAPYDSARP